MMERSIDFINSISTAFTQGGIWMWAILAVQIVSVAIIIERVFQLFVLKKPNQTQMVQAFEKDIKAGQLERVIGRTQNIGERYPVANILKVGAQAAVDMGGREEIQAQMDEVLLDENAKMGRRTGLLAMLANVGTLLGLLGTIVGLIQAFSAASGVNPIEKASLLTGGISMAMNTTAYGLIMAIPALVMYGVLQSRSTRLGEDLNKAALKAFNWLSFKYEYVPRRTARRKA